ARSRRRLAAKIADSCRRRSAGAPAQKTGRARARPRLPRSRSKPGGRKNRPREPSSVSPKRTGKVIHRIEAPLFREEVMNIGPLHIGLAEGFAVLGAVFAAATYAMQTMVPLRIAGIISNVFFILFGYFS